MAAEAFRQAAQVGDGGSGEADPAVAEVGDAFGDVECGEPGGVVPVEFGGVRGVGAGCAFQGVQDVAVTGMAEDGDDLDSSRPPLARRRSDAPVAPARPTAG
ncbi:hypothetical protein [Streptomyces sp. NPDC055709]